MPALASLFVSIKADDRDVTRSISNVQRQLQSVDKQRVQPKITLPERVTEDIKAMSSKLQALSRQQVRLNVDSTVATGEITAMRRQLEGLQRNRVDIPVDMRGDIDADINRLQAELVKAERKQTKIPITLERVDAKIAAVKGALNNLERDSVDIPVEVDKDNSLRGRMGQVRKTVASGLSAGTEVEDAGRKSGSRFGSSFASVARHAIAAAAVYGGITQVVGFLKSANEEAVEAQKVGAVTAQVIAATGGAAKISADQVGALATSLSNKTGMDDEAIQSGANLLLTFKNVRNEAGAGAKIFDRATASAVDLSAAGFGSVSGASKMLGKALNDPVKGISALSRAGVTFTKQQKEQITTLVESGRTLDAQKIILGEVESQVGGVAAASATMGEKLSVSFGNFKEQVGTAMLPALEGIAGVLVTSVIPAASRFVGFISGRLAPGLKGIYDILVKGDYKGKLRDAFGWDEDSRIVDFLFDLREGFQRTGQLLNAFVRGFRNGAAEITSAGLGGALERLGAALHDVNFRPLLDGIMPVATVFKNMLPALRPLVPQFAELGRSIGGALLVALPLLGEAFAALGKSVGVILAAVLPKFISALGTVTEVLTGLFRFIASHSTIFGGIAAGILAVVAATKAWALVTTVVRAVVAGMAAVRGAVIAMNVAMAANPIGLVALAIAGLAAGLVYAYKHSEAFRDVVNKVGSALKTGFLAAVDGVRSAIDWLGGAWTTVATSTSAAWQSIKAAVSNGWQAIVGFFRTAAATIVTPIVAAWNAVSDATSRVLGAVGGVIKAAVGLWLTVLRVQLAIVGTVVTLAWKGMQIVTSAAMNFLKDRIIAPVWDAISGVFRSVTGAISGVVRAWWTAVTRNFTTAFTGIRDQIVRPVWDGISGIFTRVTGAIRNAVSAWWTNVTTNFRNAFAAIRDRIVQPIWTAISGIFTRVTAAIRAAVSAWWTNVRNNFTTAFTAIRDTVSRIWGSIRALWDAAHSYIRGKWDAFWGTIKRVGSDAIGSVRDRIDSVFGQVRRSTDSFVGAVGRIFGGIKEKFAAPWRWVKSNVFDKIASVYNKVAKVVGAPTLNLSDGGAVGGSGGGSRGNSGRMTPSRADGGPIPIPKRAYGGVIRGRGGPREDNIMGIDRKTGVQTSWVSAKEFVVNAKSYAANKGLVETINAAKGSVMDRAPRVSPFADGGLIPKLFMGGRAPVPGGGNRHGSGYPWARWAGDFPSGSGGEPPVRAWKAGVVAAVKHLTTSYGKHVKINHGGEQTLYAHLNRIAVNAGQRVKAGQTIGRAGWTGNVRPRGPGGAHLHFEIAGGSAAANKGTGDSSDPGGVMSMINPRAMFQKGANKILDVVGKGLGKLGIGGKSAFADMVGQMPRKAVNMLAGKLPESFGIADKVSGAFGKLAAGAMKALGRGRGAIKSAMQRLGADSVGTYPGHQPSMNRAWDAMISSKATGDRIAGHLAANRGKYGIDYLIWNRRMLRSYDKGNIKAGTWGPYFDGNSSNPNRAHTNHVHASFKDGGYVGALAQGGIVRGGRGGVTAQVGEGRFDELVTPLPRGWKSGGGKDDAQLARLITLIEERGLNAPSFSFQTYNPIAEPQSLTTNHALQRVAGLGLV